MLKYCQTCDRTVLPNPEGLCPGCRRADGLQEARDEILNDRQQAITLRSHAKFPGVCAFCGVPTTESKVLTWSRRSPHAKGGGGVLISWLLGGMIVTALRLFLDAITTLALAAFAVVMCRWIGSPQQVISFRLPHCAACRKRQLDVIEYDWDDYRVRAYCHPEFCKATTRE